MKRMKTFLIYLLLVVTVVLLTNPLANLILETNYKALSKYEIATTSPIIKITESKATKANGRIKGTVTNTTDYFISDLYVKIEFKGKTGNTLGTEYREMGSFKPDQEKEFTVNFRYSEVDNYIISTVRETEESNIKLNYVLENAETLYKVGRLVAYVITPGFLFLPLFLFTGNK